MRNLLHEVKLQVPRKDIYYISWNLDACEGLGFLKTDDACNGKITIFTPDSQLKLLLEFIEGHRREGIEIEIENMDKIWESINGQR